MMKKSQILLIFLLSLFALPVYADITPLNAHPVEVCVKFDGMENFPGISLVEREFGPLVEDENNLTKITGGGCLNTGYKFNAHSIYWINDLAPEELHFLKDRLSGSDIYVSNNDALLSKEVTYSLLKDKSGDFYLEKTHEVDYPAAFFQYLIPLLMTIFAELVVLLILLKALLRNTVSYKKAIILGIIINLTTFTVYWTLTSSELWYTLKLVFFGEIMIFLLEALAYKRVLNISTKKALTISALANIASIIFGSLVFPLTLWLFDYSYGGLGY